MGSRLSTARVTVVMPAFEQAVLAFSGVRHHYNRSAPGQIDGVALQLVQCMHRRTEDRWMERGELVTDDLERMFWSKFRAAGASCGQSD